MIESKSALEIVMESIGTSEKRNEETPQKGREYEELSKVGEGFQMNIDASVTEIKKHLDRIKKTHTELSEYKCRPCSEKGEVAIKSFEKSIEKIDEWKWAIVPALVAKKHFEKVTEE